MTGIAGRALPTLLLLSGLIACSDDKAGANGNPAQNEARDGHARFTVLSPTLIRLEYAEDDRFENGPTQTVAERPATPTEFSATTESEQLVLRTSALTLRYRKNSGAFTTDNLSIELRRGAETVAAKPDWTAASTDNLGGWRRGLDNEQDPVELHDGLLSRQGWYLLDDSATALLKDSGRSFATRPARTGAYQDGYFFGYGLNYKQGLADLRLLTGAAPLLPRKAFGVWFSRYWAYSETEIRDLVQQFRNHNVPLDTLSIDTDWKLVHNAAGCEIFDVVAGARPGDPCSWNGWGWNLDIFPDPSAFLGWAHSQGLQIGLNIHPSISTNDPHYADTVAIAGELASDSSTPPCRLLQADVSDCKVFDWTQPEQLQAYFALHEPLADGIDFWWLDWCCDGSSAVAPGLTADTWINAQYARLSAAHGSRWPAFSRIGASFQEGKAGISNKGNGAFAEHRTTLHFTGDTCGTWPMLAFEAEMTAAEGNIGMPYVSHDIGSFLGPPTTTGCNGTLGHTSHLPDDMYVRWLQFGVFQPLDRLHSSHGDRLPWDYPGAPETIASEFLRLRERLVPYLYTLAREAHDTGLPMVRSLYLEWPQLEEAYGHRTEYLLGDALLIAPVTTAGDPASVEIWLPPGGWTDYFTGEHFQGPASISQSVPLSRCPVFVRDGAVLPTQPEVPTSSATSPDSLVLTSWPGNDRELLLYDDEGIGFGYRNGAFARTPVRTHTTGTCRKLDVGAAQGSFPGQLGTRNWTLRIADTDEPQTVTLDGQAVTAGSKSYDAATRTLTVLTGPRRADSGFTLLAGACP